MSRDAIKPIYHGIKLNPNYPDDRRSVAGREQYTWVLRPPGIVGKIVIGLRGDKKLTRRVIRTREFREYDITDQYLYEELNKICPWMCKEYHENSKPKGGILTPHVCYERYYQMYHDQKRKGILRACQTAEHYENSPKLIPYHPQVDTWVDRFDGTGQPISLEEVWELAEDLKRAKEFL